MNRRRLEKLQLRKTKRMDASRPRAVMKQHKLDKLTVRERLDILFDTGSFIEYGGLVDQFDGQGTDPDGRDSTCDGLVVGHGLIHGRSVVCAAYDFTVFGGSMGRLGGLKEWRARRFAMQNRLPMIWLLEGGGARIQQGLSAREAGYNPQFQDMADMSGLVPLVGAVMGPCYAGHANIASVCDFVPMVRRTSSLGIAGPELVRTSLGEHVSKEEMGGSRLHAEETGMVHMEVEDDRACMRCTRKFLSYLPSHCGELPPRKEPTDDADRRDERLLHIVPQDPRRAYDMKEVVQAVVDHGDMFEIQPRYARNILTIFARMDGYPVGIIANQPSMFAGTIDIRACDKMAHFMNLCGAFHLPMIFFQDIPGVIGGSRSEREGIVRHSGKLAFELNMADVPKFTVIVRKAYGMGHYVMCPKGSDPDLFIAWPGAEIAAMGPEGGINILYRQVLENHPNPNALRESLVAKARREMDPVSGARAGVFDDVIDPRETRPYLIRALRVAMRRCTHTHHLRRGITPI